ncbi:MAG: PRC-barrel domain-containing protein [Halanaerobiaceae bacterium]
MICSGDNITGVINLRRGEELIGLSVITLNGGKIVGEVKDVVYVPVSRRLKGLLIMREGNNFFLSAHNIHDLGRDVVIIENSDCLQECRDMPGLGIKCENNTLAGERVITENGRELGMVTDLVINEDDLEITGYELSAGLISDLLDGRNTISLESDIQYGRDRLILKNYKEE